MGLLNNATCIKRIGGQMDKLKLPKKYTPEKNTEIHSEFTGYRSGGDGLE